MVNDLEKQVRWAIDDFAAHAEGMETSEKIVEYLRANIEEIVSALNVTDDETVFAAFGETMTPDHPRWQEFVTRLNGPEGCNFHEEEDGTVTWLCKGGRDKSYATAILERMGTIDIEASLRHFEEHGGYCDCEVLFNCDPG